jgi:hypothetical protein
MTSMKGSTLVLFCLLTVFPLGAVSSADLFAEGTSPFYYVSLIVNKNTHASSRVSAFNIA